MKNTCDWLSVAVPVTEATLDLMLAYLYELGADGIVEQTGRLEAFFPISMSGVEEKIRARLQTFRDQGFAADPDKIAVQRIPNQDWNREWKKNYHSLRIGRRLLVHPSWEPVPAGAPDCVIQIDPEMAFGTGTHATTQLCLRLLEECIRPGDRVLDIGTGTGILAIAAVKLGAESVHAFDVDAVAVETAARNAAANGVASAVHISVAEPSTFLLPPHRFDWVVANINRDQIVRMLPWLQSVFNYSVGIILSGLIVEEEALILEELARWRWEVSAVYHQQEWLACLAKMNV
ncbi:MAG TPA: 50S ribosomal protein L11 methyltransferase [bacterium]|nr:50S ribosomal protein L11 methyltransferase [bacterium]HPN36183.1 50S ribosomal protein L11 methyltransferase [bacterium]